VRFSFVTSTSLLYPAQSGQRKLNKVLPVQDQILTKKLEEFHKLENLSRPIFSPASKKSFALYFGSIVRLVDVPMTSARAPYIGHVWLSGTVAT